MKAQRYDFTPNTPILGKPGAKYDFVWHCHIVDHEDNEMMRPDESRVYCARGCQTLLNGTGILSFFLRKSILQTTADIDGSLFVITHSRCLS